MKLRSQALSLGLLAIWFSGFAACAQNAPSAAATPSPAPAPSATAAPLASPTPLPLAELTEKIVAGEEERGRIEADLADEKALAAASGDTSALTREIEAHLAECSRLLSASPSLETIRGLETRSQDLGEALSAAKRSLTERIARCDEQVARLDALDKTWAQQAAQARNDNGAPTELRQRMETLSAAAKKTRAAVQKRRAELWVLQNQAQKQETQLNDLAAAIKKGRTQAVGRLFATDTPLWGEPLHLNAGFGMAESRAAWARQWTALSAYVQAQPATFLVHALLFAALLFTLYWARRRVRAWADDEPRMQRAALVFELPGATAIAFSLLAADWIYPQAPHLFSAICGAAALVPAILILRRLLDRHLFPILNALVVFYCIDQLRTVAGAVPLAARLLFVAEMAGGVLVMGWMLHFGRLKADAAEQDATIFKVSKAGGRVAFGLFLAAFLANIIGCVSLGNLLGDAVLHSAYLAVVLYAATRIADAFIIGGLSVEPLSELGMVRRHRNLLWRRAHRTFEIAALLLWASETLDMLSLRSLLVEKTGALLIVTHKVGNEMRDDLTLLGQLLSFGLVVWAAFLLSRFLRFALEEDFYPRMRLERGLSYAVSMVLHYTVLLLGFYAAASAAGVDMSKFTVLVGAFGVGMGFGLQNVINNFVSGIILLFERPVKVGDVVQMGSTSGVVDHIGIRASIIRTGSGSEIIVPNGKLISDQVVNWTLSNRQRGIELPVSVPCGTDPCRVIELLTRIASAHALVAAKPTPKALLAELGTDTLQFQLLAWTDHYEQWTQIRSDLAVAINAELLKEGMRRTIPTPPVPAAQGVIQR